MIPLTLEKIATIVGGKVYGDKTQVITSAPVFDSRAAVNGSLFLALVGDNSDGHDFVSDAKEISKNCCWRKQTFFISSGEPKL